MNQTSLFIFNIYHYMLSLRDTLEFVLPNEHTVDTYNQRKTVLVNGIKPGTALGNFFENNKENGDKIKEKINEMIGDLYSDDSNVLVVNKENNSFRVDHTQHIKIYEYIVGLQESVRDIVYGYMQYSAKEKQDEEVIAKLVETDEHVTRLLIPMLVLNDFFKSFTEFQKVMSESKGQPTPQSNFIVQNEIVKYAGYIRFSRAHCHCIDNKTLDLLDEVNAFLEMTEGRRERRDGKQFNELYNDLIKKVQEQFNEAMAQWRNVFPIALDEYKKSETAKKENNEKDKVEA